MVMIGNLFVRESKLDDDDEDDDDDGDIFVKGSQFEGGRDLFVKGSQLIIVRQDQN